MKLSDLISPSDHMTVTGNQELTVTGISTDSRQVVPGNLFAALKGENADGLDFVPEAIERGAVGILVSERLPYLNHGLIQVVADDLREALGLLSNRFYSEPAASLRLIGVTGTNGKTTIAVLTRGLLESAGIVTGLLGSIYYGIGERRLPSDLTTPPPLVSRRFWPK